MNHLSVIKLIPFVSTTIVFVGGGNYDMFAEAPVVKDIQEEGAQLLIDFITNNDISNIPQVLNFKVEL